MTNRIKRDFGINDLYEHYLDRVKNKTKYYDLDKKKYKEILVDLNKSISDSIIKGEDFVLPFGFHVRIKEKKMSYKKTTLKVDWKSTNELWLNDPQAKEDKVLLYYLNQHTNGFSYKWFWDKYRCSGKFKAAYSFIPSRENKKELGRNILNKTKNNINLNYFQ